MTTRTGGSAPTRERIVTAALGLHEEVGPAATTISAVAARAGVQRLTVYRHFPDASSLLAACWARWRGGHPFPDPDGWTGERDAPSRLVAALERVYGYYATNRRMLERLLADEGAVEGLADLVAPLHDYRREQAGALAAGWGAEGGSQRRVRVAVGHALRFSTWASLAEEGLTPVEAARLMTDLVRSQTTSPG